MYIAHDQIRACIIKRLQRRYIVTGKYELGKQIEMNTSIKLKNKSTDKLHSFSAAQ